MYSRILWIIWALLAAGATIAGIQAQSVWTENVWILPALALTWVTTLIGFFRPARVEAILTRLLSPLRRWPSLLWFIALIYLCMTIGIWLAQYQPTNGRALAAIEYCYLLAVVWGFIFLIAYGVKRETVR